MTRCVEHGVSRSTSDEIRNRLMEGQAEALQPWTRRPRSIPNPIGDEVELEEDFATGHRGEDVNDDDVALRDAIVLP